VPTATFTSTFTPIPTATPTPTSTVWLLHRTENLLVLGVDHRKGDPDPSWRTDTIMVVALDKASDQVGVVNIPRDLWVDIPGYGKGRINQADYLGHLAKYPGGGPALLRRVLTQTLDIPATNYVRIQMDGLVRLVDALGGVTVTLECPLYERTPDEHSPTGMTDWSLPAGQVWLNGEDAKKFATYRYITSDFGRTRRQQQLLWAIRDRALQLDVIPRIPELWKALADAFSTDLGLLDVIRLARLGATLQPEQIHGMVMGTDTLEPTITEEGAYVLILKDPVKLREQLGKLFEGQPLAELGKKGSGGCPPPPGPAPTLTPTPEGTVTPTPEATAASG
jgi:LCP family protein required for cell wall assembly